jgi:hypothetical protein
MSDGKGQDNTGSYAILLFAVAVLGIAYWEKHKYKFFEWCAENRFLIAGSLSFMIVMSGYFLYRRLQSGYRDYAEERRVTDGTAVDAVLMGTSTNSEEIYLDISQLLTHGAAIGTTKAGKSESVIAPLSIDAIEKGRGFIMIDGKAEGRFIDKLYAYAVKAGRAKDFRLFSL